MGCSVIRRSAEWHAGSGLSLPSYRFSLCPGQVAISWTGEVTEALTCISTGLPHCRFDQTGTGSGRCQDGEPTEWPVSSQPDMARGKWWRPLQSLGRTVLPSLFQAKMVSELSEMLLTAFFINSSAEIIVPALQIFFTVHQCVVFVVFLPLV